jgi:adenine-specific DNA methylase
MTKYKNKLTGFVDSMDVIKWLQDNLSNVKSTYISVSLNRDGIIKEIDIGKTLSASDKTKIISKFPELKNKEVN